MKQKLLLLLLAGFLMSMGRLAAQTAETATMSIFPTPFTAEDEITITVDVTGTSMTGSTALYLWAWSNAGDALTNGSWTNSSEQNKFTNVGNNRWQIKFTPTNLYGKSPGELASIGFLVKTKDGSAKTVDFNPIAVDPLVFTPSQFRTFPSKPGANDIITVFFDQNLTSDTYAKRMTAKTYTVMAYDASNQQIGEEKKGNVRLEGNGVSSFYLVPNRLFTVPAGKKIAKIRYKFEGTVLGPTGAPVNHTSPEGETTLIDF